MKLKILSLVCALGIFAFGTNGMAQDAKTGAPAAPAVNNGAEGGPSAGICPDGSTLKAVFDTILCPLSQVMGNADCKTFCDNMNAKPTPKPTLKKTVDSCMSYLTNPSSPVGAAVKLFVSTGCSASCNAPLIPLCYPCKDAKTFSTCTTLCCFDPDSIKQCLIDAGNKTCPAKGKSAASVGGIDEI